MATAGPARASGGSSGAWWLAALTLLLLIAFAGWSYLQLSDVAQRLDSAGAVDPARVASLEQKVAALSATPERPTPNLRPLEDRITALESRPAAMAAAPIDLAPLEKRLTALESRPTPASGGTAPTVDLEPLQKRIDALEHRPAPAAGGAAPVDLSPLEKRLGALEQRPAPAVDVSGLERRLAELEHRPAPTPPPAPVVDLGPLEQRLKALENPKTPATPPTVVDAEARQKVDAVAAKLGDLTTKLQSAETRAGRAAEVEGVAMSLAAGRPLGDIPGAPPALARFAHEAPPTEASLRLSFDEAAHAAENAVDPAADSRSVGDTVVRRLESLVTVRRGERVIIGTQTASALAKARSRLDAGDLPGAVAALDGLDAAAAQAMAAWRGRAQSVLDARSALAALVRP